MKHVVRILLCVAGLLCYGCVPSADISGWELVPNRRAGRMETFPEIPVILPATAPRPGVPVFTGPMFGLYLQKLDEGSLFRRGYSAPTP